MNLLKKLQEPEIRQYFWLGWYLLLFITFVTISFSFIFTHNKLTEPFRTIDTILFSSIFIYNGIINILTQSLLGRSKTSSVRRLDIVEINFKEALIFGGTSIAVGVLFLAIVF